MLFVSSLAYEQSLERIKELKQQISYKESDIKQLNRGFNDDIAATESHFTAKLSEIVDEVREQRKFFEDLINKQRLHYENLLQNQNSQLRGLLDRLMIALGLPTVNHTSEARTTEKGLWKQEPAETTREFPPGIAAVMRGIAEEEERIRKEISSNDLDERAKEVVEAQKTKSG